MDTLQIRPRKKVFCRELNTGNNLNGTFYYDEELIKASIFRFDESFYINGSDPIYLQSENNRIISLLSNFTSPPVRGSRQIEPIMNIYEQRIRSNNAIIGHDKWEENDLIKRVVFSVNYAETILTHFDLHDNFVKHGYNEQDNSEIFTVETDNLIIRAYYSATYTAGFEEPREIFPRIELEFKNDVTIENYLDYVSSIIQFLSLSLGVYLIPSEITIDRLSLEELTQAVKNHSYSGDYSVLHLWPITDISEQDVHINDSLIIMRDDLESEAMPVS